MREKNLAAPSSGQGCSGMTGDLAAFQSGLALALRGENTCPINPDSAGFRFTGEVRRSWCELRTFSAARAILTLVPVGERRRLIAEYVDGGGGLAAFPATEQETLLAFLATRLPDPSHPLTISRMQIALARAQSAAASFVPLKPTTAQNCLAMAPHADLVWCHADPNAIMSALDGGPVPPVGLPDHPVFFAPGVPGFVRAATADEAALCRGLPTSEFASGLVRRLLTEGVIAASATAPASLCRQSDPERSDASRLERALSA
jgi:hypothetical protein